MNKNEVYAVIAIETGSPVDGAGEPIETESCYCICNTREVAQQVIDKDTRDGHIHPGAWISPYALQTEQLV